MRTCTLAWGLAGALCGASAMAQWPSFDVTEKSVAELQAAQASGTTTSQALVEAYLARIRSYDQSGPSLNAIVTLNPNALKEAQALDRERRQKGPRGPLHGIPVVVKDNYETLDMPTSGGTLGLATLQTGRDAFQVARLRQAGAVILGKTTLHELAAGITTVSSLTAQTRNPYDLQRVPGGSSGGTAVAVAASFAAAGMGTDTCGSIRIPAGNQNLVGIRVTRGLSSRSGVVPLSATMDEAGPIGRSVTDVAALLDATVGPDPLDKVTADAASKMPASYVGALNGVGFKGKRIGVLNALFGQAPEDAEVGSVIRKALDRMQQEGATLVDVSVAGLDDLMLNGNVIAHEFKFVLADYLGQFPNAPIKTLQDVIDNGLDQEQLDAVFRLRNGTKERDSEAYRAALAKQQLLRERVTTLMQDQQLDVIAYPVLRRKAVRIGEAQTGFTCQLSANSGLPAISVPAGFTDDEVPVGMELLGRSYQEASLLGLARAWEVVANPRKTPFSTPPLVAGQGPVPVSFETQVGENSGPRLKVRFVYDPTTAKLKYQAAAEGVAGPEIIAATLQQGTPERPGPVVANLLRAGQVAHAAELDLRAKDRAALAQGRFFVHLYTLAAPLGVGRTLVRLVPAAVVTSAPR